MGESEGWRPAFVREIRACASEAGILGATNDLLIRDNVSVTTRGDIGQIHEHTGGLLFIGNHNKQFEFVALMAILGQMGRTSMKNIVKFYVDRQVEWALGDAGTDVVLPVYPRLLAKDRKNKLNSELGSRIVYRRSLQTAAESARRNQLAVDASAAELSAGGVVNIFPCGSVVNIMNKPWRTGVGRIIRAVPDKDRESVLVVPYHADNLHRLRLLGAVAARGKGPLGRPQHIEVGFGITRTIEEIMELTPLDQHNDPAAITDVVRQQYEMAFEG